MAKEVIAYNIEADSEKAGKSLSDLKKEFKEAQKELSGLTQGTKEYIAQLEKLGRIKDDISDLNTEIKAFNPEGKIKALGTVVGGLASGFSAAQGAMALFGTENKELEKTLLKVQAAMAFSQGIQGLSELGDAFKVLWNIIRANPIGAIVTALALVGTAVAAFVSQMDKSSEATKQLTEELELQKSVTQSLSREISRQVLLLQSQGASEQEIIAAKKKLVEQQINEIRTSIALHKSKLQDIKDNDDLSESLANAAAWTMRKIGNDKLATFYELAAIAHKQERIKVEQESIKQQEEDLKDLENQVLVLNNNKIAADNKSTEKYIENRNKEKEAHLASLNALLEEKRKIEEAEKLREQMAIDKQLAIDEENFNKELANEQRIKDAKWELFQLESQENLYAQLQYLEAKKAQELSIAELTAQEKALIEEKYDKQISDLKQAQFNQQLEGYQSLVAATQAITDIAFSYQLRQAQGNAKKERDIRKKQFQVNKAFGIANSIIDGVQAVQKALNNPYPLNIILAVASGIMATANTAKIAATKFDDGGAGAASGGDLGGNISAPNIAPPSQGSTQLNSDGTVKSTQVSTPVVKAIVTETDITKTQKKVNSIEEKGKL